MKCGSIGCRNCVEKCRVGEGYLYLYCESFIFVMVLISDLDKMWSGDNMSDG